MVKVYVSSNESKEEYLADFKDKLEFVSTLSACDKALVFLDADTKKAKQDINFALDKKKSIVYITSDNYVPESGLEMQLGLETGFTDKDDMNKVLKALQKPSSASAKKSPALIVTVCILVAALIYGALFMINKSKDAGRAEPAVQPQASAAPSIIAMDTKLQKALIESGLDTDGNGFISKDELVDVTELNLSGKEIADVSGLIYAENLKSLDLSNNDITEIQALVSLKNLEELDLRNNKVTDYSYIKYLPSIKTVHYDDEK